MVFIPALNTVRVSLEFTLSGEICVNVFYLNKSTTVLSTDLTTIINTVKAWWTGGGKNYFHSSLSLSAIRTRDMTSQAGLVEDYVYPVPEAGIVGGVCAPANVAVVVSHRTGLAGRSYRGRTYFAGIPEAAYTANYLDATYPAAFGTALQDLMDDMVTAGPYVHSVASFYHLGSARGTAVITPVTYLQVDSRLDTQRRRLPKH